MPVDLTRIISGLRSEKELLDRAIGALERLPLSGTKRRGRPPKRLAETDATRSSGEARIIKK